MRKESTPTTTVHTSPAPTIIGRIHPHQKWRSKFPIAMTLRDPERSHKIWRILTDIFIVLVFQFVSLLSLSLLEWAVNADNKVYSFAIHGFWSDITGHGRTTLAFSYLLICVAYLMLIFLLNRFWVATGILWTVIVIFSTASRIKMYARNEPVLPVDIATFSTNTGDVMTMVPDGGGRLIAFGVAAVLLGISLCIVAALFLGPGRPFVLVSRPTAARISLQIILTAMPLLFLCTFTYSLGTVGSWAANLASAMGDQPELYDAQSDAWENGYLLTFLRNVHTTTMTKPAGYSQSTMKNLAVRYRQEARDINVTRSQKVTSDTVIFILSESYSDPTRVPGVQLSKDPMPYIRSLKSQTTSGLMLSSGYGGGTANLEFQALTGLSTAVLSSSLRSPYQQLVPHWKQPVSFNQLWNATAGGSIAFHPYTGSFYSRNTDYKKFGFSHFYTKTGPEYIKNLKNIGKSPNASDESAYENVLASLKADKKHTQRFIQLATMQNHMPYEITYYPSLYTDVSSTKYKWSQTEHSSVSAYATGMHYTDTATQKFLKELDKLNRPVTVVWYGDHLPGIYSAEMSDTNNLVALHLTDYFIWSNQASQSSSGQTSQTTGGYSSPNYFMAQEAEHTNSYVTPYLAFLTRAHEQIPALQPQLTTVAGLDSSEGSSKATYLDSDGNVIQRLNKQQYQIMQDYRLITYDLTSGEGYLRYLGFLDTSPR